MANALVCLHASAGSGGQWSALAAALGDRYTVHARPGRRRDARKPDEDVAIAGRRSPRRARPRTSWALHGGAVALLAALRNPRAVASLVMYEPVPFWLLRRDASGAGFGSERSAQAWRECARWPTTSRASSPQDARACGPATRRYWSGAGAWTSLGRASNRPSQRPGVLANFTCLSAERAAAAIAQP